MRQSNEPILICPAYGISYIMENQGQKKAMKLSAENGRIREKYQQLNHYDIVNCNLFTIKCNSNFIHLFSAPICSHHYLSQKFSFGTHKYMPGTRS